MVARIRANLTREAGQNRHRAGLNMREPHGGEKLGDSFRMVAAGCAYGERSGNSRAQDEEENRNGDADRALEREHIYLFLSGGN